MNRNTAFIEAFARALAPPPWPSPPLLALEEEEIVGWGDVAAACPAGWRGAAAGER